MIKNILIFILSIVLLSILGFSLYRYYAPDIIATILLEDKEPGILPEKMAQRLKKVKKPVNEISEELIKNIHDSNISLDKILKAIDNFSESEANALLNDINSMGEIDSHDKLFDLVKNEVEIDFDIEPLRESFKNKIDIKLIKKALRYANEYKNKNLIDFESAKKIAKQILKEKEKEFEAHNIL